MNNISFCAKNVPAKQVQPIMKDFIRQDSLISADIIKEGKAVKDEAAEQISKIYYPFDGRARNVSPEAVKANYLTKPEIEQIANPEMYLG